MQTVGNIIRSKRHGLGLTLQELADSVGCAKSYLSLIENDKRHGPPSRDLLERLERALTLEAGALVRVGQWQSTPEEVRKEVLGLHNDRQMGRRLALLLARDGVDALHKSGELRKLVDHLAPEEIGAGGGGGAALAIATDDDGDPSALGPFPFPVADTRGRTGLESLGVLPVQVPVINRVAAGYPKEFTDLDYPARIADEYVSVPSVSDADAFAARVSGDSMSPTYLEGDIVVFSPGAPTPEGTDCFVRLERDGETTFKRVYFETDGAGRELIRLQPLNSAYAPRTFLREEVAGLYAAVSMVRALGQPAGAK